MDQSRGQREAINAAKQRLVTAKSWRDSASEAKKFAQTQLKSTTDAYITAKQLKESASKATDSAIVQLQKAEDEVKEAESFLKEAYVRWEVIDVDQPESAVRAGKRKRVAPVSPDNAIDVDSNRIDNLQIMVEGAGVTEVNGEENDGSDEEEEDEEKEELWELKVVLKPAQILQSGAMQCATDSCDNVACCIWSSSLDPETPWYSCLDCQANDFGGWPENKKEIPIKVLSDELREALLEKCTKFVEPVLPDLPSDTNGAAANKSKDEGTTTEEDKSSDDDAGNSGKVNGSNDEEEEGEQWDLTKIFSVDELSKKKPTLCSYAKEGECELVACSRWESNGEEDPWYCCLDCQENDFGGWPEEKKELPVDFLTDEHRQLITEKCSAREDPTIAYPY